MSNEETVFDIIDKATSRSERFHSETLAWLLQRNARFLRRFINELTSPTYAQKHPLTDASQVDIRTEERLADSRRIDVTVRWDGALVGIEVKTTDASATDDQLNSYYGRLQLKYPDHDLCLLYLTPFTEENCPRNWSPDSIAAVKEFARFTRRHPGMGRHINWKQVSDLYPTGAADTNAQVAFLQHRQYVIRKLCDVQRFQRIAQSRELTEFFGAETVARFFEYLKIGDPPVYLEETAKWYVIPLNRNRERYEQIIDGILLLLDSDALNKRTGAPRHTEPVEVKKKFERGECGEFYGRLFAAVSPLKHVWLEGKGNLGLRARHPHHAHGVSITLCPTAVKLKKNR